MNKRWALRSLYMLWLLALLVSCAPATPATPVEIIYRDWEGVMPQSILDQFLAETGVKVTYLPYASQEDAIEDIKGGASYDVVVMESQLIPGLVETGLIAPIRYQNIPNFKNISANFRDLAYDPGNRYSVPYSWGMTGLIVDTTAISRPVTRWADLWELAPEERIVGWTLSRYMLGISLKSLGYSANSENPDELEAALQHLLELQPHLIMLDWESAVTATRIMAGDAPIGIGQADDLLAGQSNNASLEYILPEEGAILWGDNYTIPFNSSHPDEAEQFINFLLRDDIAAKIIQETYYWLPNDAALGKLPADLRNNTAIFPRTEDIQNAEILMPLSPEGEVLYEQVWQRFLDISEPFRD